MKILFKLTIKRELVTLMLKYNYFKYFFQVLLMNIILNIKYFRTLNISVNTTLKYYESQGLNEKLKLMGGTLKPFSKKLMGHKIFISTVSWVTKYFLKNL